jgi:hypothetical protein
MGAALSHHEEPQALENRFDLTRPEDRCFAHELGDLNGLRSDEFHFEFGLAVLQQQLDDFLEVALKLVEARALRMGTRPPGNVPDEHPCLRVAFDDCGIGSHSFKYAARGRDG